MIGSYNVGLTIVGPNLPRPGETVLGHTFDMGPGGKGSNQAIGARRLGADVRLVVKLGEDRFADDARQLFQEEGLAGDTILTAPTHTGVGLILVNERGDNMISVAPGANARLSGEDLDRIDGLFTGATHLLCQLEATGELFVEAARRAKEEGVTVILNPAPARDLPDEAYRLIDVLVPNQTELDMLTGGRQEETQSAARGLIERGVGQVVVTMGEEGALWVDGDGHAEKFPAVPVEAVDTTGAGDAFTAGLAAGLSEGLPIDEAIRLGVRAGAFCVTHLGVIDGLPTRGQLEDLEGGR